MPDPRASLARCAVAVLLSTAAVAAQEPDPAPRTAQPDGAIRFTVDPERGMPIAEFVALAQKITGRAFVVNPAELNGSIHLVGKVDLARGTDDFWQFFQSMLYTAGYGCVIRGSGNEEICEIVSMNGARRGEVFRGARFVPSDELGAWQDQSAVSVLTVISLAHVNANAATNSLRPFFANHPSASQLVVGSVGDGRSVLLQGFAPDVFAAARLVQLADQPEALADVAVEVLELEHANAVELVPVLRAALLSPPSPLAQGVPAALAPRPPLRLEAVDGREAIVLVGVRDEVVAARDLAVRLDRPVEPGSAVQELRIDGDTVELTLRADARLPLRALVDLAQRVTGRTFVYSRADVADPALALSLAGPLRTDRAGFLAFVGAWLRGHGLVVEPLGDANAGVLRIRSATHGGDGPRTPRDDGPRQR